MVDSDDSSDESLAQLAELNEVSLLKEQDEALDPIARVEMVYQLWRGWADFQLYVVDPYIPSVSPPIIVQPEYIDETGETEFVYPIHDYGYKLTTSKAEDAFSAGMSMCKLFYTIEKMIFLLIERLKTGGIDVEREVQIAIHGHEQALRKAFESVINLKYNVVVTNFQPGSWGDRYLEIVKRMADKGFGYPPETPRDYYRHPLKASKPKR